MAQRIHVAAMLFRDDRLFLMRSQPDAAWEIPGGLLLPEHEDVDSGMDARLLEFGVRAPAVEEDFIDTIYLRDTDDTVVFNIYAPTEWVGEPTVPPGVGAGWFNTDELQALHMDSRVRNAILASLGLAESDDDSKDILAALGGLGLGNEQPPSAPHVQQESPPAAADAMDVLRTLGGGRDPEKARDNLRSRYPGFGDDIVSAIGIAWTGPDLDRKTRSLQVVAMLAALGGRSGPLKSHINGALNHGATPEQLIETLKMVAVYSGFPAALEAWPVMEAAFSDRGLPRPGTSP